MRINSTFSKDSADCIATLSSAVECIQFMCILPDVPVTEGDEPMTPSPERTLTLSTAEIRSALCVGKDLAGHPLDDLEKLLQVNIVRSRTEDASEKSEFTTRFQGLETLHQFTIVIPVNI